MPYGFEPLKIERFGGLNTLVDPTNLPSFASPDCSDVEFLPGLVRTRPGTTSLFAAIGGNPTVNYLKSYITPTSLFRALVLDSLGNFYKENPFGTLALIGQIENSSVYGNSVSLFNREYIAFGDGKIGAAIPRQFDDTNFDRVSQVGPGIAPVPLDENMTASIAAPAVGASQPGVKNVQSASEIGNIVTITTDVGLAILAGAPVVIAGVGAGYNGTWTLLSANEPAKTYTFAVSTSGLAPLGIGGTAQYAVSTFTLTTALALVVGMRVTIAGVTIAGYNGTWTIFNVVGPGPTYTTFGVGPSGGTTGPAAGLGTSGNGTATVVGNIVAGVHLVSVMFVTRQGYVTAPAPFAKWTSAGNLRVVLVNIPLGPPNVVQRIVCFTAAGGKSFFYSTGDPSIFSSNMIINDNSTTTATFDFSDAILLSGVNVDQLFNLLELGECVGVAAYSSRLFWWGERNKIQNFVNLSFDGGGLVGAAPAGWLVDPTSGAGGVVTAGGIFGQVYIITGNNVAATRGLITQSAYQDSLGNPILAVNTSYSVRAWLKNNGGVPSGTIHVQLQSTSASISTTGISLSFSQLTSTFVEYTAVILTPQATIPSDLLLRVYVDGTPNSGSSFSIDNIEIFPTNKPLNATVVRASRIEDPESYDGVRGFLQIGENNGQAVRVGFVIRNNLYFVKERSLYVTQDDGVNEPNQWTVQEISQKVGTLSVRGVGLGDEWAIIAGLDGVYYFDGGEPQKISQEIQPTWDSINWSLGHLIDVKVDTKRKRVYIAVPLGAVATANNRVLTLDYTDGFGDPNPTNTVNIAGIGRKWSPWTISCNSMNLVLRSDGTQRMLFGNQAGNGKIYQLDTTGTIFTDDGVKINDYWQSGYFQTSGRLLFGMLAANVVGVGSLSLILRKGDQGWLKNLRSLLMSPLGFRNLELNLNVESERIALRFASAGVGDHFSLQGLAVYARESVFAELRGVNY